ncbi:hypothetical protein CEUSTIGMA_g3862.t1 [Chlamydomonas eustigma]|uniref:Cytochrome P450 n=1 Tax=Chlamydomonas eustigma TaxID=1157962 RepID=A0A250X021_9CHLO|nr:hypothetical protein CEUSTIGMA_g3862.t1 [Chlamydomonas eustigma]|eukprot:GAX76417.1 hypothetical protein CEUSTIGMA_g3862.t1 [Chlamydomonas eustigma]
MAREVLLTKNYPKSFTYSSFYSLIGGKKSLITSEGEAWHQLRQIFNPGFHYQYLKSLVPVFTSNTDRLLRILERKSVSQEVVPMHLLLTKLTLGIICEVVLGEPFEVLKEEGPEHSLYSSYMELMNIVVWYLNSPGIEWTRDYLPWNAYRMWRLEKKYTASMIWIIKKRLAESKGTPEVSKSKMLKALIPKPAGGSMEEEGGPACITAYQQPSGEGVVQKTQMSSPHSSDACILSLALKTAKEKGVQMDLDTVLAQVKSFLFAGHDTTASTVAWAVYELSCNKVIEDKMVEEIRQVCGGAVPTADDLSKLTYVGCVVKETLRMWPPAGTTRIAPKGSTLKGYDIGGHPLYIPHYCLHRDPQLWGEDADIFRPERWLDEIKIGQVDAYAYQPFSKGPRDCIGQTFAVLEAKTLLAMMYSKFSFQYAGSVPERQTFQITSHPLNGAPMRVIKRTQ